MNDVQNNSGMTEGTNSIKGLDWAKEYRCPVCKRLLMKGKIISIETKCPKCKKVSIIRDQDQ